MHVLCVPVCVCVYSGLLKHFVTVNEYPVEVYHLRYDSSGLLEKRPVEWEFDETFCKATQDLKANAKTAFSPSLPPAAL